MDKNEEMICDDCGKTFQSSIEVPSPIKHCPKCVEKSQEEMLRIMFGLDSKSMGESVSSMQEKPELLESLLCFFDPDLEQVAALFYESNEETFYRHEGKWKIYGAKGEWKKLSSGAEWEFDLDGSILIYVNPEFVVAYDEAEQEDIVISYEDTIKYESKKVID